MYPKRGPDPSGLPTPAETIIKVCTACIIPPLVMMATVWGYSYLDLVA